MVQLKEKQSTVITSGRRSNSEQIRVPLRNFSPETIQRHVDPYVYKYLNNYCTSDVPFCSLLFFLHALRHSYPRQALTHYPRISAKSRKSTHARTHPCMLLPIRMIVTLISCTLLKCLPITRCVSVNVFIYVYIYIYRCRCICIYIYIYVYII